MSGGRGRAGGAAEGKAARASLARLPTRALTVSVMVPAGGFGSGMWLWLLGRRAGGAAGDLEGPSQPSERWWPPGKRYMVVPMMF